MKISVQTANIIDPLGVDRGFAAIREAGFDAVDYNIDHELSYQDIVNGRHSAFYDKTDDGMREALRPVKEAADRNGIEIYQMHAPFPCIVKGNDEANAYIMHALKKTLMAADYLDCRHVIVHPFFYGYEDALPKAEEKQLNLERYGMLIEDSKRYGVTVCLENMFTGRRGQIYEAICSNPTEACWYIDTLNEMAGEKCFAFCLDVGHAMLLGRDIYTVIAELGSRIEALHIHDNNAREDQHLFPYMGIVDWDRFVKGLKEIGYRAPLSFETFNALNAYPPAVHPEALRLLAAIGRDFARRIEG